MKALTIWQPHASLFALGVRWIATRGWSTSYRGPLAIHAAARPPTRPKVLPTDACVADVGDWHPYRAAGGWWLCTHTDYGAVFRLPLGAIVATCELVDVVPMVENARQHAPGPDEQDCPCLLLNGLHDHLWLWDGVHAVDVEDQRPYGDFSPGRWAWILADVKLLPEPIPAKGKQGLWKWAGEA